jgi:serine/threonine-protein kinase
VAGYEVECRLGAGGYGTVYRARSGTARVALKLLPLETSGGWEEREVDVLRRSRHPHVVRLLGYVDWPEDEPCFRVLLMEYVDGLPLDEWVRRRNPSPLEVVELLLGLLEALEALHAAGVVHRDVKASNILVRASDEQPVLVDFGAGAYPGAPTLTTSVLPPGTPEYRGPEAWDFFRRHLGETGARYQPAPADDLWAVGIQLYWVLTDRLPFTGPDFLAIGAAVLNERPVPPRELNPWVPEELEHVCLRMLEKAPGARYADAGEVRSVLSTLREKADASWCEPLFEPHAPHNATTRPQGGLAEGQELRMRLSRLARQPPRRGGVPTVEATPVPDAALQAQVPSFRAWPGSGWLLSVLTLGGLAVAAAMGPGASWKTEAPSEVVGTTQPDGVHPQESINLSRTGTASRLPRTPCRNCTTYGMARGPSPARPGKSSQHSRALASRTASRTRLSPEWCQAVHSPSGISLGASLGTPTGGRCKDSLSTTAGSPRRHPECACSFR